MSLWRVHRKPWSSLKQQSLQLAAGFFSQSSAFHSAPDTVPTDHLLPYPEHYLKLPPWIELPPIGSSPDLLKGIEANSSAFLNAYGAHQYEALFEKKVKPFLVSHCILAYGLISDLHIKELHFMNKDLIKHFPVYITSLSLMKCLVKQREQHWQPILRSLVENRVMVLHDWVHELTPVQVLYYDHGVLLATQSGTSDSLICKAECDASFKATVGATPPPAPAASAAGAGAGAGAAASSEAAPVTQKGFATIASIIWESKKMIDSQITRGLPSQDSEHAEALALLSVLQRGRELKISVLDVVIDNLQNYKTMIGELDVFEHKHRDVMIAAIQVAKEYDVIRFRYEPRELLCLVNEMANAVEEKEEPPHLGRILEAKAYCLWGLPVVRINQSTNKIIKNLAKAPVGNVDMEMVQSKGYYVEVHEAEHKLDAVVGLLEVLDPKFLVILVKSEEHARIVIPQLILRYHHLVLRRSGQADDITTTSFGEVGSIEQRTAFVLINETKMPQFSAQKVLLVAYDSSSDQI